MHYAVLDLEHGAARLKEVEELCRSGRMLDFPFLIRPEGSIFHLLRKYLDMGPAGFLLPWTERPPEQARFWIERGFRFFIYSEVRNMVRAQTRELVDRIEEIWAKGASA